MAKSDSMPCSRRRFLAAGSAAVLAALLPLPRRVLAGQRSLLITDDPMMRADQGVLLLVRGDRLARLQQMRDGLRAQRPALVEHHLDSTDQVLLDVALVELGAGIYPYGNRLYLHYR